MKQQKHEDAALPAWQDLMEAHGAELWTIRARVFSSQHPAAVPLRIFRKTPRRGFFRQRSHHRTMVVGCPHAFRVAEERHGIDKPDPSNGAAGARPLTRCTGEEWIRQRTFMIEALRGIPGHSLGACEHVRLRDILSTSAHRIHGNDAVANRDATPQVGAPAVVVVDLKEVAVRASVAWVVALFRGRPDGDLGPACRDYWEAVRRRVPLPAGEPERRRKVFAARLRRRAGDGGVLGSMHRSGLSTDEAVANAVNAMIAAMDALQALFFWTVWNLARTPERWEACRAALPGTAQQREDRDGLAAFKKAATQGTPVHYAHLSYLGRALCETVRVFPPVWTLPRTWIDPGSGERTNHGAPIRWSKLEVATVNGARSHSDWNPERCPAAMGESEDNTQGVFVASFGLGKRHCPAGTAALVAVYKLLLEFLHCVEAAEECEPGAALESTFLLPTLSLDGPQMFRIRYAK